MYDLIGDIHGHAGALQRLLDTLGYRQRDGIYRHESRQAIFVGDFVDRGPEQRRVIEIARPMVESGAAQAVMGNHEFNAVAYATEDPKSEGHYLRPRNARNQKQHAEFLDAYADDDDAYDQVIDWFGTLPLWLELPGLRVIHACWHEDHITHLQPLLAEGQKLSPRLLELASRKGGAVYQSVETLLKGLELPLPEGHFFRDKDGTRRVHVRTRWWLSGANSWKDVALGPPEMLEQLPDIRPEGLELPGYEPSDLPVFFGHYWMAGTPRLLAPNVACLDYSVARGGQLVAYRWSGEQQLSADGFVAVAAD